jgi:AmmeMemoRadiSam system protein B
MTAVIHPYCVGKFFPAEAVELREKVEQLLRATPATPASPKAIIAPHASYDYSGPIAASAYAYLAGCAERIRQVVLLGTCHFVHYGGLLTTSAEAIDTPLGPVRVDRLAVERAAQLPQISVHDEAHRLDHALAVQLPLLRQTLSEFSIVPFLVTDCDAEEVADVLELLWDGDATLILVSSDLSHNLGYDEACRRDRHTARAILQFDADAIGRDDACGYRAIAGLLLAARQHNLRAHQIDLRNSGDTIGRRDHVVGYGAFAFEEPVAER